MIAGLTSRTQADEALFSFQYKGVYPTMEEASRLSAQLRQRMQSLIGEVECGSCGGSRLRDDAAAVRFRDVTIDGICRLPLGVAGQDAQEMETGSDREKKIAGELIREIIGRVNFLNDVGLGVSDARSDGGVAFQWRSPADSLGQPAWQRTCAACCMCWTNRRLGFIRAIIRRLLKALHRLRDLGNTMIVVEHDREVIEHATRFAISVPKRVPAAEKSWPKGRPKRLENKKAR